jgi:hypothetical protein
MTMGVLDELVGCRRFHSISKTMTAATVTKASASGQVRSSSTAAAHPAVAMQTPEDRVTAA